MFTSAAVAWRLSSINTVCTSGSTGAGVGGALLCGAPPGLMRRVRVGTVRTGSPEPGVLSWKLGTATPPGLPPGGGMLPLGL